MTEIVQQKNIGALIDSKFSHLADEITAGATADNDEVTGAAVDRLLAVGGKGLAMSCKLVIPWSAILTSTKTLSLAANLQHSSTSTGTYADLTDRNGDDVAFASEVVATGTTDTSAFNGVRELSVDLSGAKRYIRAQITPDISTATTDTAFIASTIILGGATENPVDTE